MRVLVRLRPPQFIFFFKAEGGIRDFGVTGVQTCALPISVEERDGYLAKTAGAKWPGPPPRRRHRHPHGPHLTPDPRPARPGRTGRTAPRPRVGRAPAKLAESAGVPGTRIRPQHFAMGSQTAPATPAAGREENLRQSSHPACLACVPAYVLSPALCR